jgi:hypothetical protein
LAFVSGWWRQIPIVHKLPEFAVIQHLLFAIGQLVGPRDWRQPRSTVDFGEPPDYRPRQSPECFGPWTQLSGTGVFYAWTLAERAVRLVVLQHQECDRDQLPGDRNDRHTAVFAHGQSPKEGSDRSLLAAGRPRQADGGSARNADWPLDPRVWPMENCLVNRMSGGDEERIGTLPPVFDREQQVRSRTPQSATFLV